MKQSVFQKTSKQNTVYIWYAVFLLCICACRSKHPQVIIETSSGTIIAEIYADQAPVTAGNFLKLIDENKYDEGAVFYRVTRDDNQPDNEFKIDVIQGGLRKVGETDPIPHETTRETGLRHLNGSLSMARSAPGTAGSEFFICIGDQPELDFGGRRNPDGAGFAVFGRVIQGMDVVRIIQQQRDRDQYLIEPVLIHTIRRSGK
ncbi:MAG: peptidylprolyl isomerase [Tannerella sp.]|jgi:peptidyl-prolyl cis-trans isomerase A (cyclophilin A)|nr:peptidylprolyl isomerase [Tannerella sp.]